MLRLANLASLVLMLYQYWVLVVGCLFLSEGLWPGILAFLGCVCVAKAADLTRHQLVRLLTR